ncbi:hypothetical protein COB21_05425 [Candidatus Aerophobetes bacterium]|uniref:Glycosyl transferase family 1 domain-containing protein n=1 Tax=Aerophobetes bacterium TaxID=2030807 RepID=A0A2A4WZZ0_UNCAE|nr:MAG: hypothetical protein COB21_05425 [Candidatus Aerophobetes bacterium]
MKQKILLDFFFTPEVGKFFSVNIWASNLLLILSKIGKYKIDVIVGLGGAISTKEGQAAIDYVWDAHYDEVFPSKNKNDLRLNKAFYYKNFDEEKVKDYDVLIQVLSCSQVKNFNFERSIIIHYDLIPLEYLHAAAIPVVAPSFLKNTEEDKHIACISKPVRDNLTQLLPHTQRLSKVLPIVFQHLSDQTVRGQSKSFDQIVLKYASKALDRINFLPSKEDKYVLKIGSLDLVSDRKNHRLTLLAWEKYCQMFPQHKVKLVLLGGGGVGHDDSFIHFGPSNIAPERLRHYLKTGEIIMLKNVCQLDVISLIKRAQCLVLPSKAEGFGMPAIEAMYFGCPAILSDIEIFKWVAKDAALFCNPYSVDSLVSCFIELLVSTDKDFKRKNLIDKGYQNIKRFSFEEIAPLWESFIDTVASFGRTGAVL